MEYFLPLSVMAMIISSISFYLIDYDSPNQVEPENDQSPSNPSDSMDSSAADYAVSESDPNPQNGVATEDSSIGEASANNSSTSANLKEIHPTFGMLWATTP